MIPGTDAPAVWKEEATLNALQLVQRDGSYVGKRVLADDLERFPDNEALFALYCGCLLWTGERERGHQMLLERVEAKRAAPTLAALAIAQRMANEKDEATDSIEASGAIDPDDYLYLRHGADLAVVEAADDRFDSLVSRAEALYPGDPWFYGQRITFCVARGRVEDARRILDAAPLSFKALSMYHHHWGSVFLHERNLEAMEEQYRYAVAASPENSQHWAYLSMAQRHLGKFHDAIVSADFALELDPTSRFALETHAKFAERNGDLAAAKKYEARIASSMPGIQNSEAHEANKRLRNGDVKGAISIHCRVLQDPKATLFNKKTAENCLMDIYSTHGYWRELRVLLDAMQAANKLSGARHAIYLAESDFQAGIPSALEQLEMIARETDPPGNVFLALIRAYLMTGNREKLLSTLDRVQKNLPSDPVPLVHALLALHNAGENALANTLFEELKRKRPNLTALRYYEIVQAAEQGDLHRARHLNRQMPDGERIKPKSVVRQILRGLFGPRT